MISVVMILLNFTNVEDLIFFNNDVKSLIPQHLMNNYYQWKLGRKNQFLRMTATRAILDFLNSLTNEDIEHFEKILGDEIKVEKFDYKTVKNYKIPLSEVCDSICEIAGNSYYTSYRDSNYLYISTWR